MALSRRSRLTVLALVLLLVPWGAFVPAAGAAPAGGGQSLLFKVASFDPVQGPIPEGLLLETAVPSPPYLVQFLYPLKGSERAAMEAVGGTVAAYVPYGGFVVLGPPSLPAAASKLPGVRFVGSLPPALKVDPEALGADTLSIQFAGPVDLLLSGLSLAGARALVVGLGSAVVVPGPAGAAALARLPTVLWVEAYHAPSLANYRAVLTDMIRQVSNSSYSTTSNALWSYSSGVFLGYPGTGVTLDVTDLGVDGTHPAFGGRLGAYHSWTAGAPWVDPNGHGTHVAGTAVGDGSYFVGDAGVPGLYAGAAPRARLIAQAFDPRALNYTGQAQFAADNGATISLNSWGDTTDATLGAYTGAAAAYDAATSDASPMMGAQPILFVFSAGNGNNAAGSITPPGTAKNVITVGATGNDVPNLTPSTNVTAFSSYGPADDGRIKPDLVAPGERVASANSSQDLWSGILPAPADGGRSYIFADGTSMAAPQVAGAAAVATQFLSSTRGVTATPALLKALLVNGAEPLPGYAWPGPDQGWGRLDLSGALLNSSARRVDFVPEGFYSFFSSPDTVQFNVSLDPGAELRVTLVWTDAAGSPLAASALVNDLDLEVRDANDTVIYAGNQFAGSFSTPTDGLTFDRTNNVEVVRLARALGGTWKIFVRAYSLPMGAQSFALAISGAINRSYADLALGAPSIRGAPALIESGGAVTIDGQVENMGAARATNVTVAAVAQGGFPAAPLATWTAPVLSPGEVADYSLTFLPAPGAHEVSLQVSGEDPDGDLANNRADLAFFVALFSPSVSGVTDASARPGETAVFDLSVTNAGNALDTLFAAEDPRARDPAWGLSFSQTQFALAPGATAALQVFIDVPAAALGGDTASATVLIVSGSNTSRLSALDLVARASAERSVRLEPLAGALTVAPGATQSLDVRVTNTGNTPEAVTLTLQPMWTDAADWSATSAAITLAPGEARVATLALANADVGVAGYRGQARLRAQLSANGATFDTLLPVFLEARPCLEFAPMDALDVTGRGAFTRTIDLRNCGNTRLTAAVASEFPAGFAAQPTAPVALSPGQTAPVEIFVTPPLDAVDSIYAFTVRADAVEGASALSRYSLHYRTGVSLAPADSATPDLDSPEGSTRLSFTVRNTGNGGWILAPKILGLPEGALIAVLPERAEAAPGGTVKFTLIAATSTAIPTGTPFFQLAFFPGSDREGEFTYTVHIVPPRGIGPFGPQTPGAPPGSPYSPLAVAAGVALALGAAAVLSPSRRIPRACPSCQQPIRLFDSYKSSSCTRCGAALAPRAEPPR